MKTKLTTTLNKIRSHSPCGLEPQKDGTLVGFLKLRAYLGEDFNPDSEINLLTILESNGVQEMLWCLRTTVEDSKKISSLLAIEFAEEVLPIFEAKFPEDKGPRKCLQACRDFNDGLISLEELQVAAYWAAVARAAAAGAAYWAAAAAAAAAAAGAGAGATYWAAAANAAAAAAAAADDAYWAAVRAAADAGAAAAADAGAGAAAATEAGAAAAADRGKMLERQAEIIKTFLE